MSEPARPDSKSTADTPTFSPAPPSPPSGGEATEIGTGRGAHMTASGDEVPPLPEAFGRYAILRRLGRGGMGVVYLARDTELDRLVALKMPHLEGNDPDLLRERFLREARAAALLHHPHICPVFDVGAVGAVPYLTMAYIEGQPLDEWAANQPGRPAELFVALVRTLALALAEAHAHGVIHRDLKPSNVLVDRRGEPVVMDFGLARRMQSHKGEERLTYPGAPMGTPAYMPPEQVLGQVEAMGPASDVYSLGVILYELLAGACPFDGPVGAVLARIVAEAPRPPSALRPGLDPRLDAICLRALAKEPEKRFASMTEFARVLGDWLQGPHSSEGKQAPGPAPEPPDPRVAGQVLSLLRTWGWAQGVQKVRARAQRAQKAGEAAGWQAFLDWVSGDAAARDRASTWFAALPEGAALQGWVLAGQASFLLRDRDYAGAHRLLDRAAGQADPADVVLRATVAHTRGAAWLHQGRFDRALPELHRALDLLARGHFLTGRVLDTLGMAYAGKGHFPVAREFYEQSIRCKQAAGDEAGMAVSHGQLGRLYLDWGHLDEAEHHLQEDLRLAQKLRSRYSEAQVYDHLGQVASARGQREAAAGRRAAARRHTTEAAGWLDQSIRLCQEGRWAVPEGFARKDRALVWLQEGDLAAAEQQARQAAELFHSAAFGEGTAQVQCVQGMILRARRRWDEAERILRSALAYFDSTQERDEAARAQWEIARTLRDAGAPAPLVRRAYLEALGRAEACRHAPLVRDVEDELRDVDCEAYLRHLYQRARGHGVEDEAAAPLGGSEEVLTVLLLDLPGFADFARGLEPEAVLLTFNQLLADCGEVLARHQAQVLDYPSGGLMAVVRDARHAERGTAAALDLLAALEEFNRPRQVLGLPLFRARLALHTGHALLGNVGTFHKMDYTAVGAAVGLAAALLPEARPGLPCLTRATRDLAGDAFLYHPGSPRTVTLAGFGACEVWDVLRRNA
jgi:class 3 adenylate cyclase/predicted Ser/Thr protein kinase